MTTIFRTDISQEQETRVRQFLALFKEILKIDFDFEDCDKILRIETAGNITSHVEIILNSNGHFCKEIL